MFHGWDDVGGHLVIVEAGEVDWHRASAAGSGRPFTRRLEASSKSEL